MKLRSLLHRVLPVLVMIAATWVAGPAHALVFSLDGTQAPAGVNPADILESFGGGQYRVAARADSLGLRDGDDITGLHNGAVAAWLLWFSVDRHSTGLDGTAVRQQVGRQAADIFVAGDLAHLPAGTNAVAIDNLELELPDGANIDAAYWFSWQPERAFLFTLSPGSPTLALLGATAADILIHHTDNTMAIFRGAAESGLLPGDVIDAFQIAENTSTGDAEWLFSLAPGSPTLAALGGASPADLLTGAGGKVRVQTPAWMIGLNATDNLDMIGGTFDCSLEAKADNCKIPEPGSLALAAAALALLAAPRARRKRLARPR